MKTKIIFITVVLTRGRDEHRDIQLRINKSDWSAYDQTNDFSFNATYTAYAVYDRIALYRNGTLIWGYENGVSAETPAPVVTPEPTTVVVSPDPTSAPLCVLLGDVNGSGAVDIVDALQIARCYVGIISCSF